MSLWCVFCGKVTSLDIFTRIGKVILDPSIPDVHLRDHLYDAVPQEALETQVAALEQGFANQGPDVFQGVMKRYSTPGNLPPISYEPSRFCRKRMEISRPVLKLWPS